MLKYIIFLKRTPLALSFICTCSLKQQLPKTAENRKCWSRTVKLTPWCSDLKHNSLPSDNNHENDQMHQTACLICHEDRNISLTAPSCRLEWWETFETRFSWPQILAALWLFAESESETPSILAARWFQYETNFHFDAVGREMLARPIKIYWEDGRAFPIDWARTDSIASPALLSAPTITTSHRLNCPTLCFISCDQCLVLRKCRDRHISMLLVFLRAGKSNQKSFSRPHLIHL